MSLSKPMVSGNIATLSPFPICCAGKKHCRYPDDMDQHMTTECDHCNKDCHDMCGEVRDVPAKILENFPAFFCLKCLSRLPKRFIPRFWRMGYLWTSPTKISTGMPLKYTWSRCKRSIQKVAFGQGQVVPRRIRMPTRKAVARLIWLPQSHHRTRPKDQIVRSVPPRRSHPASCVSTPQEALPSPNVVVRMLEWCVFSDVT
jgi:hypothetical protein